MRIGFLGGGNMGGALMQGLTTAENSGFSAIAAYDPSPASRERLAAMGVETVESAQELFDSCDAIVLAVKPQILRGAVEPYAGALTGKLVISIAAGWTIAQLKELLPEGTRILRAMPNTASLVSCGICMLCEAPELTEADRKAGETLFGSVGTYMWLDEHYIDAVIGVSGSGAAYVYMFIDAMACGGVRMGLPRDLALKLAAQTVNGAAQMVLQTGSHPDALKDAVCSPAGTTIEAVRLLEQRGLRSAVMDAVICCAEKSHDMSKGK